MTIRIIQLGKNGITENFIGSLQNQFKSCKTLKISVLRSCCRDRDELKKIAEEILEKLGQNFRLKIIGYTIILKKRKNILKKNNP